MQDVIHHFHERIALIRQRLQATDALTMLDISSENSIVVSDIVEQRINVIPLEIGAQRSARDLLRHTPPQRLEFEMAIEVIEDEIIRHHRDISTNSILVTDSLEIKQIAQLAGIAVSETMVMEIDAMERVFSRLAAVIQGKPASSEGIPEDNTFAIRLLILREFMHHLHFEKSSFLPMIKSINYFGKWWPIDQGSLLLPLLCCADQSV